jgi:hypothetical protein
MQRSAAIPFVLGALALACSSAEEPVIQGGSGSGAGVVDVQPAAPRASYPPPPYGSALGAVIENHRFLGWSRPTAVDFDEARLEEVSLASFYDPTGDKGIRYVVLTSTAVWCGVCRLEYDDFRSGRVAEYGQQGVVFFGALFEDNDGRTARPSDLTLWANAFDVDFPFVLDPAFKLGAFFDREATPMTMVIDASTMKVVWLETGWAQEGPYSVWGFLDSKL